MPLLKIVTEDRDVYVTPLEIRQIIKEKDKETCTLLMESGAILEARNVEEIMNYLKEEGYVNEL